MFDKGVGAVDGAQRAGYGVITRESDNGGAERHGGAGDGGKGIGAVAVGACGLDEVALSVQ